ncbi:BLOC-1-related complex subunit 5 isoform X1 [Ixodes scapularis]|uniref:BLOC-1-related complex subunit 5 isoform X1 n=1 Tax=Ixodes scapularis TaxID=6945 RepID=UPI001C38CDAD|nr:BLOC-1-related complex subunit 5 isoform X1 [Ixodes scapularis]XP_042149198.1 BLOC-1-related complex subunit 5 isoform X1 [Ixodes scapularis]
MGLEQSSHAGVAHKLGKVHKKGSSPRPSISSDSDVPYISSTVNNPIGESPKLSSKSPAHLLRNSPRPSPKPRPHSYAGTSGHDIVVVKEGSLDIQTVDTDEDLLKLQAIPQFLPILRGSLHSPIICDADVADKLDHRAVNRLASRYQDHLRQCSEVVSTEQNALASRIREMDYAVSTLSNMLTERQKKFAKYVEQLSRVHELSGMLQTSQTLLTKTIEQLDTLNKLLPPDEQLEPFIMVTG